jgi:DNA-directed RNA polymerase subunit RPC12/RpoP
MREREMPQVKMRAASRRILKIRPVIASPPDEPLVRGHGNIDYICAGCDRVIAASVEPGEIKNLVFECSGCGTDNQIP